MKSRATVSNAVLVPPNDAKALADAIGRLAADAELRHRFGAAGRRIAEEEFSYLRIGQEIVELYQRLLSQSQNSGWLLQPAGTPG